eukprot:CAMPEP_0181433948 /NCGR_PEP_ID=MMETSP1110-20121109/19564_1 /TAXON_ID=174948 /ORGANISM="Symbiodinium sp., Strain CCMP421" /LENGTH=666 /DNA_ID=CAMNT_0023557435 /DNA_START=57 /DNA_END=2056 /DNA_ORIENTATION=-
MSRALSRVVTWGSWALAIWLMEFQTSPYQEGRSFSNRLEKSPLYDHGLASNRALWTFRCVEWGIDVPLILCVSGHFVLGRPLRDITRPFLLTSFYVILCWVACETKSAGMKWSSVVLCFLMSTGAARDILKWCSAFEEHAPKDLPNRSTRPKLVQVLLLFYAGFCMAFLLPIFGINFNHGDVKCCFLFTFGTKCSCIVYLVLMSDEYHKTLTDLLWKVSTANLGMTSILRSSFDIILPCTLDTSGCCRLPASCSGDMSKLESILMRPVAGADLKELLANPEAKADFAACTNNLIRQVDSQQTSNTATLALQGVRTVKGSAMPPMAQVLHSQMLASGTSMDITLHLSVVPPTTLAKECQLIAAIRFAVPEAYAQSEPEAEPRFETFLTEKEVPDIGCDLACKSMESIAEGIVASLADLPKLGLPAVLASSQAMDFGDEGAASPCGRSPSNAGDETMTLSKLLEEVAFKTGRRGCDEAGIIGSWEGTVSESLGGYHQHIVFEEGGRARVTVGQQTFMANYTMNCLSLPMTLDLELPSAIIPYIFKLEKGCLHLCGAGCGRGRPKSFHGPGLCIMNRADSFDGLQRGPELEQPGISHFASSPPELSGKKAFGVPAVLKFMENQPALMASAMMAAVGAVVALAQELREPRIGSLGGFGELISRGLATWPA